MYCRMKPRLIFVSVCLLPAVFASFCGQAAIPFTFQSLRSGQPVLGCARPRCFGWNANGTRADDTAQFYRINGKEDGYLRRSDIVLKAPERIQNEPQTSKCEEDYRTANCEEGQWVGGIAPLPNPKGEDMPIRCCSYSLLVESEDRGTAPIKPGQVFIGGEVLEGNRLVAFDYIADINKKVFPNNTVLYEISVRRMPCFDDEEKEPTSVVSSNADLQNLDGDVQFIGKDQKVSPGRPSPYGVSNTGGQRIVQYGVQQSQTGVVAPRVSLPQTNQPLPMSLNGNGFNQGTVYSPAQIYQPLYQNNIPRAPLPPPQQVQPVAPSAQPQNPFAMFAQTPMPTIAPLTLPKLEDLPQIQIPSVEQVEEVIPPMQRAILANIAKFFGVL